VNRLVRNFGIRGTLWSRLKWWKLAIEVLALMHEFALEHFGIGLFSKILRVVFRGWHAIVVLGHLVLLEDGHLHGLQLGDVFHQRRSKFLRPAWAAKPIVAELFLNVEWLVGQWFDALRIDVFYNFWIYLCAIFFSLHWIIIYLKYIIWLLIIIGVLNDWINFCLCFRVWALCWDLSLTKLMPSSPFFIEKIRINCRKEDNKIERNP